MREVGTFRRAVVTVCGVIIGLSIGWTTIAVAWIALGALPIPIVAVLPFAAGLAIVAAAWSRPGNMTLAIASGFAAGALVAGVLFLSLSTGPRFV